MESSPQSTYRVIAEGDHAVAGGLSITDALAVADYAREHGKHRVAIVDEETSAIVDEADARRRFIAPN
ncbi:MAG TPA: hypothetical protein VF765_38495 [Polyangiaceae bacterium]